MFSLKNTLYRVDLTDHCDVGEVAVDGTDYLIVVIPDALKLEVKVVESCQKLDL